MKKAYLKIDVKVFREILKGKYCPNEERGSSKQVLLETIQEINKQEIKVSGLNIDKEKALQKINFKELGYKQRADAKITYKQTITDTIITIVPKNIYELEDNINLPIPKNNRQKQYIALMSDTFERLKIKCENILDETEQSKHIELYASKNLQSIGRTYYEAKTLLKKYRLQNIIKNQNFVFVQGIFIVNTILYLQKMFSTFYKEKPYTDNALYSDLYLSVGPTMVSEPTEEYGNKTSTTKIQWNLQINQLITLYYDLMKAQAIEVNAEQLEDYIVNSFTDKNGNPINRLTVKTALREYRPEKRAKGKKRINIDKYLN